MAGGGGGGCDGLVSIYKERAEPQALLAVGNPVQIFTDGLNRCSAEVRAICTSDGF